MAYLHIPREFSVARKRWIDCYGLFHVFDVVNDTHAAFSRALNKTLNEVPPKRKMRVKKAYVHRLIHAHLIYYTWVLDSKSPTAIAISRLPSDKYVVYLQKGVSRRSINVGD